MSEPVLSVSPCPYDEVCALAAALDVSTACAQVLVRRGLSAPDAARAFMDGASEHPAGDLPGIEPAVVALASAVARGERISVHGDYDADGVCSTALLVRALRGAGAVVDWHLPDRAEGYGLSSTTVRRLAARGTGTLLCVDCGITAVEEIAVARAAGMTVIVADHHTVRADRTLPDALLVHPALGDPPYPCPELCATAVAFKLALALWDALGLPPTAVQDDIDLVALATIADVMPLHGENRALVRRGLRALAVTAKPGLRALMSVAGIDQARVDERAVGFGLAPRLNAAGRMQRPDAALELLLCEDPARAGEVASELDRANHDRRSAETGILFAAEAQIASMGDLAGYVVAGDGWHPGVVGIVAARLAERRHRPVLVLALDGDRARGSGRSVPGYSLLDALHACAPLLDRYGGHAAAAGVELGRDAVDALRERFASVVGSTLDEQARAPRLDVDAIVSGEEVGLTLAEELRRLAPFGRGNPPVRLLLPAARVAGVRGMGEGRHARCFVHSGNASAGAVAFGLGATLPVPEGEPADLLVELEAHEFRGTVEPRLIIRHARPAAPAAIDGGTPPADYLAAVWRHLAAPASGAAGPASSGAPLVARTICDRRDRGIAGTLGALVGSGDSVLVLCADAQRRRTHLEGRCGGFTLRSHWELEADPAPLSTAAHAVLLDPPIWDEAGALARQGPPGGFLHLVGGPHEEEFAHRIMERDLALEPGLRTLYRALREARDDAGPRSATAAPDPARLADLLAHDGSGLGRPAALAARLLRVLYEVGLIELDAGRPGWIELREAAHVDLEASATFRLCMRRLTEGRRRAAAVTAHAA